MKNTLTMIVLAGLLAFGLYLGLPPREEPCGCRMSLPPVDQALASVSRMVQSRPADSHDSNALRSRFQEAVIRYEFLAKVLDAMQELDRARAFIATTNMATVGRNSLMDFIHRQLPALRTMVIGHAGDGPRPESLLATLDALESELRARLDCLPCMDRFLDFRENSPLTRAFELEGKFLYALGVLDYIVTTETDARQKQAASHLQELLVSRIPELALLVSVQMQLANAKPVEHDRKTLDALRARSLETLRGDAASIEKDAEKLPRGIVRTTYFFASQAITVYKNGVYLPDMN